MLHFLLKNTPACSKEAKDSRHPALTSWLMPEVFFFFPAELWGEQVCHDDEVNIYVFFSISEKEHSSHIRIWFGPRTGLWPLDLSGKTFT